MDQDEGCAHAATVASVTVSRQEGKGGSAFYVADISIDCCDCGAAFGFMGIPWGCSTTRPVVNIDATVLTLPLEPLTREQRSQRVLARCSELPDPRANGTG